MLWDSILLPAEFSLGHTSTWVSPGSYLCFTEDAKSPYDGSLGQQVTGD